MAEDIFLSIKIDSTQAEKNVENLTQDIIMLEKQNEQLKKSIKAGDDIMGANSKKLAENQAELRDLRKERNNNISVVKTAAETNKTLTNEITTQAKTLNELKNRNKELIKIRNNVDISTKEGKERFDELNKKINENNDVIREAEQAGGNYGRSVGRYADGIVEAVNRLKQQEAEFKKNLKALKDAEKAADNNSDEQKQLALEISNTKTALVKTNQELKKYGQNLDITDAEIVDVDSDTKKYSGTLAKIPGPIGRISSDLELMRGNLKDVTTGLKGSVTGATGFTKALKIMKVAIAATGIGAIVIALGSLITFFTKTQRGADKLSQVFKALGAGVDVLRDRFSQVGEALGLIFSGKFRQGAKLLKESFQGIGEEIKNEVQAANELEKQFQALEDAEISFIKVRAERQRQVAELRFAAKDENKTNQERFNLLKQALQIEQTIGDEEARLAKERARISAERLALGESSREDIRETAELEAAAIEAETQNLDRRRTIQSEILGLARKLGIEREKLLQEEIKIREDFLEERIELDDEFEKEFLENLEVEVDAYIEAQEKKGDALDASLERQQELQQEQLEAEKEINRQRAEIATDLFSRLSDASAAYLSGEKDAFKQFGKQLANQLIDSLTKTIIAKNAEILIGSLATPDSILSFGATGALRAAAIIATTTAAAAGAKAAINRFDEGGTLPFGGSLIGGKSHAEGGTKILTEYGQVLGEAQRGEGLFITKQEATASLLSSVNQQHGGRSFSGNSVSYAQEGGRLNNGSISEEMIANVVRETVAGINIITNVEDVSTGLTRRQRVLNNSIIQ